jgi:methionine synthase II (cobalamin-independent)
MKTLKFALLGLALGGTVAIADDCVAPDVPSISEGEESTLEQMLAAQKAVKDFQAANLTYMGCLEPMLSAAEAAAKEGKEGAVEEYQKIQATYNDAVSREEEVATKFNNEIRDYKAANPS